MESQTGGAGDYSDVVETLTSMFGGVLNRDVIVTVVESCGGDLSLAAEAIMNISETCEADNTTVDSAQDHSQENVLLRQENVVTQSQETTFAQTQPNMALRPQENIAVPVLSQQNAVMQSQHAHLQSPVSQTAQPLQSYPGPFRSMGAVPKLAQNTSKLVQSRPQFWTDQLCNIVTLHNKGARVMILMRGAPGSGKSYLTKQIVDILVGASYSNYKTHIFSSDDYFMVRGVYQYDRSRIGDAHEWNKNRVRSATMQGLSPILIDNTNIEIWEMEPYLRTGVTNGYVIEVVEPNTPWAKRAGQLARKNSHNVPLPKIRRMLENLMDGVTGDYLIKKYGLSYPGDMVPPVKRLRPMFESNQVETPSTIPTNHVTNPSECPPSTITAQSRQMIETNSAISTNIEEKSMTENVAKEPMNEDDAEAEIKKKYMEIEKQLEVFEQVEQEWENGEQWDADTSKNTACNRNDAATSFIPKPPRKKQGSESSLTDNTTEQTKTSDSPTLLETVKSCQNDWRNISMFMPPWCVESSTEHIENINIPVETKSSGTSMEIGDTNMKNPVFKVVNATPRDINIFHMSINDRKIPDKQMLDKSTMTNEQTIMDAFRCKNEEKHFNALWKLFKNVPKPALRDIFDKCGGDVNWTVDIILEGMANNQLEIVNHESLSDTEEETQGSHEQCNCMAAYNITPDVENSVIKTETAQPNTLEQAADSPNAAQKKTKITPSESSVLLKRQIEKNVVISDAHYSDHCLKLRRIRRGDYNINENRLIQNSPIQELNMPMSAYSEGSRDDASKKYLAASLDNDYSDDDEESLASSTDEAEKTVNVHVGMELIKQLDNLFGRNGITYPEKVVPKLNLPMSLLREINAFWMESLMYQMDEMDKQDAAMLREDEEFARQLSMKEKELEQQGKEPEVPDFKEIMDMDFALSLYQKDVAEWRSKEPNDMAAKLSRDKLYNLFPEMSTDILSELLMAHDNNFQATVEVLLMSTGKETILEEKNGINKFVMEKEMERQEKLMEEEKKALSEVEWPLLPRGEVAEMSMVNSYRLEAEKHLASRNLNYNKAQDYIRRGMTQVANYYSDIAAFHKKKYEHASSLAAATLIQVHASNSPDNATIDLHYLRVAEAKETLDLFLDSHIIKLRELPRGRTFTLFMITGRGLHSNGRPRVKPAIKKRLKERGLVSVERNPGLLTTKVCADDKLAFEIADS